MSEAVKGLSPSTTQYDGVSLRVGIVHARWNKLVVDALLSGAIETLKAKGVKESNIIVQSVPGSFELPLATAKMISGSQIQAAATASDLLGANLSLTSLLSPARPDSPAANITATKMPSQPFDAIIAIGVLIKGATMHFEYISDAVTHGLMKVQLETGVPVVFGVLTAITDDQALERAGIGRGETKGHNHGEDWALAAIEMGSHCKKWAVGRLE